MYNLSDIKLEMNLVELILALEIILVFFLRIFSCVKTFSEAQILNFEAEVVHSIDLDDDFIFGSRRDVFSKL